MTGTHHGDRVTKRTTTRAAKVKEEEVIEVAGVVVEKSEVIAAAKPAEESDLSDLSDLSELSDLSDLSEIEQELKDLIKSSSLKSTLSRLTLSSSSVATSRTVTSKPGIALSSVATRTRSASGTPAGKRPRSIPVKGEPSESSHTARKKRKKKQKQSTRYAPPEKYAHLGGVTDSFAEGLISVFIGLNPGIATAMAGHAYASPSNRFWGLLFSSGLTPDRQCPPEMDEHLPRLYSLGNTNLVSRPTKEQTELSKGEMDASVSVCEDKIRRWKPESVCVVGKGIWESIWRAKHDGKKPTKAEFVWGWQADEERFGSVLGEGYEGAKVFVVPSTSGLAAGYSMEFKKEIWKELGDWVQQRRAERGETAPREQMKG